jgi:cell wall-associated NlpC family hydrolase
MMAYRSAGVSLPRTSRQQWYGGPHVPSMLDLEPGDLVFYAYDLRDPSTIHHLGMYIGGGLMVEAPYTGSVVRVRSINRPDYIGAVRPTG